MDADKPTSINQAPDDDHMTQARAAGARGRRIVEGDALNRIQPAESRAAGLVLPEATG